MKWRGAEDDGPAYAYVRVQRDDVACVANFCFWLVVVLGVDHKLGLTSIQ